MPREIEPASLDGTYWTTTQMAPTRNAPFAGLGYWNPAFAAVAVPKVEKPLPPGSVKGVKVRLRSTGHVKISKGEFGTILNPIFKSHQFEILSAKLVIDDHPIWRWEKSGPEQWDPVIASGPFTGHEIVGPIMGSAAGEAIRAPTLQDTARLPRFVEEYTTILRPTNLELPESKRRQLNAAMRPALRPLRAATDSSIFTATSVVAVPDPRKPEVSAAPLLLGGAVIIGIALTMFSQAAGR